MTTTDVPLEVFVLVPVTVQLYPLVYSRIFLSLEGLVHLCE